MLNFLPFDALVERMPQTLQRAPVLHAEFASEAFLLRRYAVSYLTSSAQLLSRAAAAGPSQPPKRFLALANPTAGRVKPAAAEDDPLKRQLRSGGFDAFLAPIPGADAEVQRIARYFAPD